VNAGAGGVPVDVDRATVAAELRQLETEAAATEPPPAGESPAPPGAAPAQSLEEKATQLAAPLTGAVRILANAAAPNWELSDAECSALGASLAQVAAHWMPDTQLPPKYMALALLGMSLVGVVGARFDQDTGKLKPRRRPRGIEASPAAAPAPAAPAAPVAHQSAPREVTV
jgi:hypothetical protein